MRRVKLIAYPKLFFVWPIIVAPVLCHLLARYGVGFEALGWLYVGIAALVLITLGIDMDRITSFVAGITLVALLLLGRLAAVEWNWTIVARFKEFLRSLEVTYDPGLAVALSLLLGVAYLAMLLWARLQNKWEITATEFRHSSLGVTDRSLSRGAKTVKTSYPDLLELLLGLAGTLHVYNANGDKELVAIPNIPLLPLVNKKINVVLNGSIPAPEVIAEEEDEADVANA